MNFKNKNKYKGHVCMLCASVLWGLMSPIGKAAMENGISALSLVTFRMTGAAICFWIASIFTKRERVAPHDLMMFFFAALLGIVLNQGSFIFGLSLTSPINASIITTTAPLITMIVAAIFLKEPVTNKKVMGIFIGAMGALILIFGSKGNNSKGGNVLGDMLCFFAQISFSCYLAIFKGLISKYSVVTCMKWMFTYAAICIIPFSYSEISTINIEAIPRIAWVQVAYVVLCATFVAFIFMMTAQKILRPTLVSMYNYVQPIVATIVSVSLGLAVFGWSKATAVVLVFAGVYIVTQSKSREDLEKEKNN